MTDEGLSLPMTFAPARVVGQSRIMPGAPTVLADLEGPGCIRRIWVTMQRPRTPEVMRQIVLRIWWDDADAPAVESPIGDFFGIAHGLEYYPLNSRYLISQSNGGLTAYFPMPFSSRARIEVEASPDVVSGIYWHVDWRRYPSGTMNEPQRFHAQFRREFPCEAWSRNYLILNAIGHGRLLGYIYGVRVTDDRGRWSHAGGDTVYISNAPGAPQGTFAMLRGSGGEDTFGAAYGGVLHQPSTHQDQAIPYYVHEDIGTARAWHRLAGYRFFVRDAIPFERSIQVRFGSQANDICSTAYWYQVPPHRPFFELPAPAKLMPGADLPFGSGDLIAGDPCWWICGPWHPSGAHGLDSELPQLMRTIDANTRFDATGYPEDSPWRAGDRHIARWVAVRDIDGFVDFSHHFRPATPGNSETWPAVGVAETVLNAATAGEATLHLAWVNRLKVQVNDGAWIEAGKHSYFDNTRVSVILQTGPNRLRVKVDVPDGARDGYTWGAWMFALRAIGSNGREITPELP